MKRLLLTAVLTVLMIAEVQAESFTISDIRVNSLRRVSVGSVFGALPLSIGEQVDDRHLAEASRALFKTGFFEDIQIGREGNVLVITVVERPSVASIDIEGNESISTEGLMMVFKQSGLAEGEIFQRATLEGVSKELQSQYAVQGHYSATVGTEVVSQPLNRVDIKVNINEGTVPKIQYINVVGNTKFADEDLLELFELKTTNWLSFFKKDDNYSRGKLSSDLERLRSYYLDHGYINMNIASIQVSITPDKKHVYITVNVDEGEKYTVRNVKLRGYLKVPEDQIKSLLLVQRDQVFSRKMATATSELITRRLSNEGYTLARVNILTTPHYDDDTVDVTFVVYPGKRVYVNRISFRGNNKSKDEVLRREMRQMEGSWASSYLIYQSKARLERLGFFKEVNVQTTVVPGVDDQIDVNYDVEEQSLGSITANLGYGQSAGVMFTSSINQNNFLGTGNSVSLSLNRSAYKHQYDFSYFDPYWTTDGVSLGYNVAYRSTDLKELKADVARYAVESFGSGVSFGYPISETSRLTFGFNAKEDKIKPGTYATDEISDFVRQEGNKFLNFRASSGWSESTLNKGILATRGHSQSVTLETTTPGSDLKFFRIGYRAQLFQPLSDNYTMRLHAELGYGHGYGSTSALPFYENYYAGGFNSVRGFLEGTLGSRGTPSRGEKSTGNQGTVENPNYHPLSSGGDMLIQGGAEILFPMPFLKDQSLFRTSLFWDVGSAFDSNCDNIVSPRGVKASTQFRNLSLRNLASSVGVGFTWMSMVGPLNLSFSLPINKPDGAKSKHIQFSLGQSF